MPHARNTQPIVIAGGGIGGLACALALAQRSFHVVVCEQAQAFGQVGVGLQVAPNALSVLDALGVGQRVKREALLIERMLMVNGLDGQTICDIPCGEAFIDRFGNPYAVSHRADVHDALLQGCLATPLIELRTDSQVVACTNMDSSVLVTLHNGQTVEAAGLIGADGVRSKVRQQLIGDDDPKFAGAVIYRALVPAQAMPQTCRKPYPTLWVGPGAHTIYYPVRDWSQFNLGITVHASLDDDWEGEASADGPLAALRGWSGALTDLVAAQPSFQRYAIRYRDPIDNWTDGAVTLLGDAAHPMVQYIAQGAAQALEDAICLAQQVDQADGNLSAAFMAYQTIRIVRSARVQLSSLMLDRLYHVGGIERLVRNSIFEGRQTAEYYDRLAWLFTAPDYVTNRCGQVADQSLRKMPAEPGMPAIRAS